MMDEKKKQAIEEIASIICKETSNKGVCEKCDFKKHKQFGFVYQCSKFDNAEDIYNLGYRKERETAREILECLRFLIEERNCVGGYDLEDETIDGTIFVEILNELKERYGVEVE